MESQMRWQPVCLLLSAASLAGLFGMERPGHTAQQRRASAVKAEEPEISLRRAIETRNFKGLSIQGEERLVGPGDTMWRILVREKGLPANQFRSYLVIMRGLNPDKIIGETGLRVGDKLFVPLQPEQLSGARVREAKADTRRNAPVERGTTINYRVKRGEHLYQIIREQLKPSDERKVAELYALVKDINSERQDWDSLAAGDRIRLPNLEAPIEPPQRFAAQQKQVIESAPPTVEKTESAPVIPPSATGGRETVLLSARENIGLVTRVAEAMGSRVQRNGEEVVKLKDGSIRLDRSNFPLIYHPHMRQRVVIDPNSDIPASLRKTLNDPAIATPVISMTNGLSIKEAVSQLLAGLGYQALPTDRPVIIQEEGIAYEAKGSWMALAPQESNKTQEVYVINLTKGASEIPEYLRNQLSKKGLHLKDILLAPAARAGAVGAKPKTLATGEIKNWPKEKPALVDSLLLSYGVPFDVAAMVSVEVREGLRVDTLIDRVFDLHGQRIALNFSAVDPEVKRSLQQKQNIRVVDIDMLSMGSRDIISRLVGELGEQSSYKEHRFPAVNGPDQERLTVTAWGFHLPRRSMFVTDRKIPSNLHRFFFEKGLEIVYFQ